MTENEIFKKIALGVLDMIPNEVQFSKSVMEIMRLEGVVEHTGFYLKESGEKEWLDIFNSDFDESCIQELYEITQNHPLEHKNWNRAIFTLYPDNKFDMEYIWDQELQDRVDGYNNDNQS